MTNKHSLEIAKVAKVLLEEMFQVKKGETVAITADTGTDPAIIEALAGAAFAAGGIPLVLWMPKGRDDGQMGMPDWPAAALTAALCEVDIWIELNVPILLYSEIWETAMAKNDKLRYVILGDSSIESLVRVFTGYSIPTLGKLLRKVKSLAMATKKVRITSANGTDVSYETNPKYAFDIDDGDFSKTKFGTAPGYVNIVPKKGSMNGKIVFDTLMNADVANNDQEVAFIMKKGKISEVVGTQEAEKFKEYLAAFEDPNMYKISHNMFGLHPNIRKLSGDIVEDERIWGGVDFGFGHTSPMDMPPKGQMAKSHFDGVVIKTTIYLDDQKIVENGEVCHPKLIGLAEKVLNS